MNDFAKARRYMVDCQVRPADVTDHAVIAAFDTVERERFVPDAARSIAYLDRAIDVGEGRALLPPMLLAKLVQALDLKKTDRAIDLACGLGYSTAILAELCAHATGIEASAGLASQAASCLSAAGVGNAIAIAGVFDRPVAPAGPVDAMLVNGAVETTPQGWLEALSDGGRIACVKRVRGVGRAVLLTRVGDALFERALFDASAPELSELRPKPEFAF